MLCEAAADSSGLLTESSHSNRVLQLHTRKINSVISVVIQLTAGCLVCLFEGEG